MDIAFYRHRDETQIFPSLAIVTAPTGTVLMFSWLQWTLDVQFPNQ